MKYSITINFISETPDQARCVWEMLDTGMGTAQAAGYAHDFSVIDPQEHS